MTLCLTLLHVRISKAEALISEWTETLSLPYTEASQDGFVANNNIFLFGGSNATGASHDEVLVGTIDGDGAITSWNNVSTTPDKLIWHSVTHNTNYSYMLGGFIDHINDVTGVINRVSFAPFDSSSGTFGTWQSTTPLPQNLALGGALVIGNKIYFAGGNTSPTGTVNDTITNPNIYVSDIDPDDGILGPWSIAGQMPERLVGFGIMEINNYIYIFGGFNSLGYSIKVRRAPVGLDGSIGTWEDLVSFPGGNARFGLAKVGNTIIVTGSNDLVYTSSLQSDGTLSSWTLSENLLPRSTCCSPLVAWGNRLYLVGGHDGSSYSDKVLTATVNDIVPTPTPGPSTPPKAFFVPGMGGSWNAEAFASCTFDNDPSHWSLSSLAESTYNPILMALSEAGWDVKPFYYDWRQVIPSNASALANAINSQTSTGENVSLVGHSMGGLVGREYLTQTAGDKLDKFLTAGSPHMGSPLSYPAWSGGEIWSDSWIQKTAMTLYLKHCGGLFANPREAVQNGIPSVGNLLPIFNYLKTGKSFKDWSTMNVKNTWHLDNDFDTHGVASETISGDNYLTLSAIQTKSPSTKDLNAGNWLDGKPAGKIFSPVGDGSVLVDASNIPGVPNVVLFNQDHEGLVNTSEGISEILSFLGTPSIPTLPSNYEEPKSALILIGYPASFWVTDEQGKIINDKNGMVSIINPKAGTFKLNLLPKSGNTLFVVAQFLPSGQVLYKEYNFRSTLPQMKSIKFDSDEPKEDILN